MKLAVVGSRGFSRLDLVKDWILMEVPEGSLLVSGGAIGVDSVVTNLKTWCTKYDFVEYIPNYALHGKSAPLVRNYDIVQDVDCVVAFWDGKSRGTNHAVSIANTVKVSNVVYCLNKKGQLYAYRISDYGKLPSSWCDYVG